MAVSSPAVVPHRSDCEVTTTCAPTTDKSEAIQKQIQGSLISRQQEDEGAAVEQVVLPERSRYASGEDGTPEAGPELETVVPSISAQKQRSTFISSLPEVARKAGAAVAGGGLVVLGTGLCFVPGPGDLLLVAAGISVLSSEFPEVEKAVGDAKEKAAKWIDSLPVEAGGETKNKEGSADKVKATDGTVSSIAERGKEATNEAVEVDAEGAVHAIEGDHAKVGTISSGVCVQSTLGTDFPASASSTRAAAVKVDNAAKALHQESIRLVRKIRPMLEPDAENPFDPEVAQRNLRDGAEATARKLEQARREATERLNNAKEKAASWIDSLPVEAETGNKEESKDKVKATDGTMSSMVERGEKARKEVVEGNAGDSVHAIEGGHVKVGTSMACLQNTVGTDLLASASSMRAAAVKADNAAKALRQESIRLVRKIRPMLEPGAENPFNPEVAQRNLRGGAQATAQKIEKARREATEKLKHWGVPGSLSESSLALLQNVGKINGRVGNSDVDFVDQLANEIKATNPSVSPRYYDKPIAGVWPNELGQDLPQEIERSDTV